MPEMPVSRFAVALLPVLAILLPPSAAAQDKAFRDGLEATDISTLGPLGGLVRFRPGSSDSALIEPDRAASWEKSADGRVLTFELPRGVQLHKRYGQATTADVVHSPQRTADPRRS